MTLYLASQADLESAVEVLVQKDPRLRAVLEQAGMPVLRRRDPGFGGLAAIIVAQQLSTASAAAIWGRVTSAFNPLGHDAVLHAREDRLGQLGLSAAKIKALKAIAEEIDGGRIDLQALGERDADEAHRSLTALRGVGPWTADIYLLFCLGHSDAWPAGDLAVQEGVRAGLGLDLRPTAKEMGPLAEIWRPLRGAAAHLWWQLYRTTKRREGAPVTPTTDAVRPKPPPDGGEIAANNGKPR